eukprot:CAMPEP_0196781240 /NCGR_PEP_ID=MMETSP1104-20130614/9327_1 /TAXON_ID=33652 /ORGANISM="Cafeteria sp., Strain Caron Lab Isolate" /LENGTH=159 /DNA_ID=CAMNT_0042151463 /DNA_START=1 /DNA_END=477 /DNA_ORIENTATION=+
MLGATARLRVAPLARTWARMHLPMRTTRMGLSFSPVAAHDDEHVAPDAPDVNVVYVLKDGSRKEVVAKEGQNLLRIAHRNDIDLEGACECSIACSTCHVILDEESFDKLEEACEEEEDMLDQAWGLTPTSRLGCQVVVRRDLEGMVATLPKNTRNMYVD